MERKRSDRIADELEGLIFDGTFPDGARLDEVMLAERFDDVEFLRGYKAASMPADFSDEFLNRCHVVAAAFGD